MKTWAFKLWSDVLTIKNGRDQKKVTNPNGKYPIYGSGGLMGYANDYLCDENTTIIGRKGSINKPIYVEEKFWNVDTAFGLCAGPDLDPKFLYYFCRTYNFLKHNKATTLPSLTKADLLQIKIPLPPLAEQKQIAAILDAADSLRQKDQQLIEHYTALSQAVFMEMFGDPVTNPKKWNTKYFSDVFITKTGKLDSNAASVAGMYPFFTCAKQPLKIDSYTYDEEALLLAGNNAAGIFDVKYYNGKFDVYQRTYILTIKGNELTYSFMKVALEKKLADLERLSIGSSTQYLTMQILKRLEFSVPPIQLQNQFAGRVAIIEKQKQQAQTNLEKSEALFNSLLQRAFTGELTADKAA